MKLFLFVFHIKEIRDCKWRKAHAINTRQVIIVNVSHVYTMLDNSLQCATMETFGSIIFLLGKWKFIIIIIIIIIDNFTV